MVRLKDYCQHRNPTHPLFQFHYGTIKRTETTGRISLTPYFNSTMVRLKVLLPSILHKSKQFQFHYGTIKRIATPCEMATSANFNSTMVRLKDFHGQPLTKHHILISIPLWYD